jgi:hypothetical protein
VGLSPRTNHENPFKAVLKEAVRQCYDALVVVLLIERTQD